MYRPASRLIACAPALRAPLRATATRRFISTAPPTQKSRSWKSLVARVGLAGAVIYYYNTTDVFAEEPRHVVHTLPETENETEQLQTIDALAQERQKRKAAESAQASNATAPPVESTHGTGSEAGLEGLEEEADQQGAFNPETGEINWDCPCLGGMADGPCGEEFKAAFSCFVYSQEEPKGMDCIDNFKNMQNCFRKYPEVYGSELEPDDEDDVTADGQQQPLAAADSSSQPAEKVGAATSKEPSAPAPGKEGRQQRAEQAAEQVAKDHGEGIKYQHRPTEARERSKPTEEHASESDEVVPKAWHDEREANEKVQKEEKN